MWTYRQSDGHLLDASGALAAVGYSGHPPHVNDPAAQSIADVGPIPRGLYSIGAPRDDPKTGPYSLPLAAHGGNEMFGRSGFLIHGDLIGHVGAQIASDGCIVLSLGARVNVWESGDHILRVVSGGTGEAI